MEIHKQGIKMPGVPLDALLDALAKQGEAYVAEGHEHASQIMCLTRHGDRYAVEVLAIAPMPGDQLGKDAMAHALGMLVKDYDAYIFLTEAYVTKVKSMAEVEALIGKVKDHPDRVEIFSLHFVSKTGESRMLNYEIKRDKETPYFGPREESKSDVSEGRFVNFYLWAREPGERGN